MHLIWIVTVILSVVWLRPFYTYSYVFSDFAMTALSLKGLSCLTSDMYDGIFTMSILNQIFVTAL